MVIRRREIGMGCLWIWRGLPCGWDLSRFSALGQAMGWGIVNVLIVSQIDAGWNFGFVWPGGSREWWREGQEWKGGK